MRGRERENTIFGFLFKLFFYFIKDYFLDVVSCTKKLIVLAQRKVAIDST